MALFDQGAVSCIERTTRSIIGHASPDKSKKTGLTPVIANKLPTEAWLTNMNASSFRDVLLAVGLSLAVRAQAADSTYVEPRGWKLAGTAGLNLSQSTFSDNWSSGEKGSVAWVANADLSAQRPMGPRFHLANVLQLAYGQTSRQSADPNAPERRVWDAPDKTTDLISFESVGRFTLDSFVDPYLSLRLDTQFSDQSDPTGDIRLNPVKLKEAAGVARVVEKTEDSEIVTRLGFGFRQTLSRTFANPPALALRSFSSNDGGLEWHTSVVHPVLDKKVVYKGQLLVFQPVFYSKSSELRRTVTAGGAPEVADYWKATNVSFQNSFSAGINKYLIVNLYAQWIYDKYDSKADPSNFADVLRNVRKAGQFKEALALGLTYRLL